jgi:hypothetical protein
MTSPRSVHAYHCPCHPAETTPLSSVGQDGRNLILSRDQHTLLVEQAVSGNRLDEVEMRYAGETPHPPASDADEPPA